MKKSIQTATLISAVTTEVDADCEIRIKGVLSKQKMEKKVETSKAFFKMI